VYKGPGVAKGDRTMWREDMAKGASTRSK